MSNISNVDQALKKILMGVPDLPEAIQFENERFTPDLRDTWIRVQNNHAATTIESIGVGGNNRAVGFYSIEIFARAGNGVKNANNLADKIIAHFERNNQVVEGETAVLIEKGYSEATSVESDFYRKTVVINYSSQYARGVIPAPAPA